jgi:Rps23 Pro-64 3,4-dihydroxylase Tpa1-like proline 4-hydroxylase
MKTFTNGISSDLCKDIYAWAETYIYGKAQVHPLGYPNQVNTMTNLAWNKTIIKDSKPVIIYFLPNQITEKIKQELIDLGLLGSLQENLSAMVYVWTPGSYIPIHEDGFSDTDRKVFTAYLNEDWSIEDGGLFHYLDKEDATWKSIVPEQGLLVYNDNNEKHYTTVAHEGKIRISLQMFGY